VGGSGTLTDWLFAVNRYDFTTTGTSSTAGDSDDDYFHISTPRGGRHTVALTSAGVSTTTERITTATAHGAQTGEPVRVIRHNDADTLPAPLQAGGTVRVNEAYTLATGASATSSSTTCFYSKRLETCIFENITMDSPNASLNAGSLIKVNNVRNFTMRGSRLDNSRDLESQIAGIRFGATVRNILLQDSVFGGGIFFVTASIADRIHAENCVIGDPYHAPVYAIENYAASKGLFKQCEINCGSSCLEYDFRDDDLESLEFDDCKLIGHSTIRTSVVRQGGTFTTAHKQLQTGGKILIRPNCRRMSNRYAGTSTPVNTSTDVVTAVGHCLRNGDQVYFTFGSAPGGLTANTAYFVRVIDEDSLTLHTTQAAATLAGATPVDITSSGSTRTMFSPDGKLGMQLNGTSRVYNVILRTRDSAFDLESVTTEYAVDAAVFLPVGVRIWNPNAGSFTSPGWTVTEASTPTTTIATLTPMPQLTGSVTLVSNVVDVGNVGTGEDDLITYTLPANTLAAEGHSLEVEAGFSLAANANSKTLKMYLGANELLGLAGAAQNDGSYYVRIVVIRDAVNTAKVVVYGGTHGGSGTPLGNVLGNAFVQPSVDFSTALTIKGTGEATSDNDVVMEFLRVRTVQGVAQ